MTNDVFASPGIAVKKENLYEVIADRIEGMILDNRLHPGDKLPSEPELAESFGVSRNVMREAMKALKEAGRRIPQDVALIGFDNTSLCELIEPALTTVHVPKQDMGRLAVERLLDAMKDPKLSTVKIELATYLVRRKSL